MKRKQLYIALSLILVLLIVGLIGWAIFVGRQQQELQQGPTDLGVLGGSSGGSSGGGGLFGGVFGGNNDSEDNRDSAAPEPILRQLYNLPTAGYVKLRSDAIRFVDRATGHVFEKKLPNESTARVDQTTVPQVYRAYLLNDGRSVIRQYIDEENRVVSVLSGIEDTDVASLPVNELVNISTIPRSTRIAMVIRTNQGSELQTLDIESGETETLYQTFLRNWRVQTRGDATLLTQKASAEVHGSALLFTSDTARGTPVISQELGLVTNLSPNGSKVLYSTTQREGRPLLFVVNTVTGETRALNIVGFADKCVWLPNNTDVYCALPVELPDAVYPDDWYNGSVHFSDVFWKIDTDSLITEMVLAPPNTSGVSLDAAHLTVDAIGRTIFFINNTDQSLWSLSIPTSQGRDRDIAN